MNLLEVVQKIAEKAHAGQFRKDGITPYIEHPRAVAAQTRRWFNRYSSIPSLNSDLLLGVIHIIHSRPANETWESYRAMVESVALLHDVLEDCSDKGYNPTKLQTLLDVSDANIETIDSIIQAVIAISKNPDKDAENYLEYLERVKRNHLARLVKLADLRHNLSDLKPGNMKDKYILAQDYLLRI